MEPNESDINNPVERNLLHVERIGGLAGFGLPGHLRSIGVISIASLSAEDRRNVELLFGEERISDPRMPDSFHYRITRVVGTSIDVIDVPEARVPVLIRTCVKDLLL